MIRVKLTMNVKVDAALMENVMNIDIVQLAANSIINVVKTNAAKTESVLIQLYVSIILI